MSTAVAGPDVELPPVAVDQPVAHWFYISTAVEKLSKATLLDLLDAARRNNAALGLSGMLIYADGTFLQYLEGPADPLERMRAKIAMDPRHKGILPMSHKPAGERLFRDWSMGFIGADALTPGAFDLSWRALDERMPEDFPLIVKTMMRQVYSTSR